MPLPGKGCSHSKPIKEKFNLGSTSVFLTQPVRIAPKHSAHTNKP